MGNRVVKASGSQRSARGAKGSGSARRNSRSRGWASARSDRGRGNRSRLSFRRGSNTVAERSPSEQGRGWGWGRGLRSSQEAPEGPAPKAAAQGTTRTGASRAVKGQPGVVYGPEKVRDLRKGNNDDLVVGQRTVVHQAAHYGILRGMLWTVLLGALLFWLPVLGPAAAGYVGGRKAGGPLRAIVAVAIPAAILIVGLAVLNDQFGIVPSANVIPQDFQYGPLAEIQTASVPIVASIQTSINLWVASPPEPFFIMGVFALAGGILSELRRREEETVIEKLGIPLGEVKQRARAGEFGPDVQDAFDPPRPSRGKHPVVVGTTAAHDGVHDLVEMIVDGVAQRLEARPATPQVSRAELVPGARRGRGWFGRGRPLQEPSLDDLRPVSGAYARSDEPSARARARGRSTGGRAQGTEALESWEEVEAIVPRPGASGGWTRSSRRRAKPLRMGPGGTLVTKQAREARDRPRLRWVSRSKKATPVAYTATSTEGELQAAVEALSMAGVPPGASRAHRVKKATSERPPAMEHVSKRLPITSSILGISEEAKEAAVEADAGPSVSAPVRDVAQVEEEEEAEAPAQRSGEVAIEGKSPLDGLIAPPAQKHPSTTPASPIVTVEARPATSATALRGRSRKGKAHQVVGEAFEEDMAAPGMIVWEADRKGDGADYFASKRGQGAAPANGAPAAAEAPNWEEERIAAIVREREEWDRL